MKKVLSVIFVLIFCFSLSACSSQKKDTSSKNKLKEEVKEYTVKITMDNWQDYFEFTELTNPERNDFGEIINITPQYYIILKNSEKYDSAIIDVAIEFSYKTNFWNYDIDLKNDKTIWKELSDYQGSSYTTYPDKVECKITEWETCFFKASMPLTNSSGQKSVERCTDFSVSRIQGTIIITDAKENGLNINETTDKSKEKNIEITMNNWQNYFEFTERTNPKRNAFEEIEKISPSYYLVLKNEYVDKVSNIKIAIEYNRTVQYWDYTIDLKNNTTIWEKPSNNQSWDFSTENSDKVMETITSSELCIFNGEAYNNFDDNIGKRAVRCTNFNIIRIDGNIYFDK